MDFDSNYNCIFSYYGKFMNSAYMEDISMLWNVDFFQYGLNEYTIYHF